MKGDGKRMAKTNQEILNQIRSGASEEYKSRVAEVGADDVQGRSALQTLTDFPTVKNEFLNVLTNKVLKSVFYSKVFENPLKMLHRGKLEYGASIEQLFVNMAEHKGFYEHFEGSDSIEGDLIKEVKANIDALYITKNFAYKYKVSVSEAQLRSAFVSRTGLADLINQLTNSILSGAYFDEYNDMKKILFDAAKGVKSTYANATGLMQEVVLTSSEVPNTIKTVAVDKTNVKELNETVRALAGRLSFPSTAYNMAGVRNWSNREDLLFITTPEIQAKIDVEVLAQAFNVSSADLNVRTIILDELPTQFVPSIGGVAESKECLGLLVDRDFIQSYDLILETRTFDNPERLSTNVFMHKQGIMSTCYFANAVALIAE